MPGCVCSSTLAGIGGKLWIFNILGSVGTWSRGSIGGGMLDVTTVEAYILHRENIRLPEDARHAVGLG